MKFTLYADESGTHDKAKCYTIGAILVPEQYIARFRNDLQDNKEKYKITSEIKWHDIRTSYNIMNFSIDVLRMILRGPYIYTCIVVLKNSYRKWQIDQENAFYTTYTLLIEHCTKNLQATINANIDNKSDSYPKHHEVVEIIAGFFKISPKNESSTPGFTGSFIRVVQFDRMNNLWIGTTNGLFLYLPENSS